MDLTAAPDVALGDAVDNLLELLYPLSVARPIDRAAVIAAAGDLRAARLRSFVAAGA